MIDDMQATLARALADPELDTERGQGPSAASRLAAALGRTKYSPLEHDKAVNTLAAVMERAPHESPIWNNVSLVVALARFEAPDLIPLIRRLLRETPRTHGEKRAALVDLLVEFNEVLHPDDMDAVGDLKESRATSWLDAAATIQETNWLRQIFLAEVPSMLVERKLHGMDIAVRLDHWIGVMPTYRDLLVEAARAYVKLSISSDNKAAIQDWLHQHYPTRDHRPSSGTRASTPALGSLLFFVSGARSRIAA